MSRYEGMDELLERVRLRLQDEAEAQEVERSSLAPSVSTQDPLYESLLTSILVLIRDADQLLELLPLEPLDLTEDQRRELLELLTRLHERTQTADRRLQR
jgi:hypothetical protein